MTKYDPDRRTLLQATTATLVGGSVAVFDPVETATAQTGDAGDGIAVDYDVDTLPGLDNRLEVTITIEVTEAVLTDAPPIVWRFPGTGHELRSSDGIVEGSSSVSYKWDRESAVGSVTFRYDNRTASGYGVGDDWAVIRISMSNPDGVPLTETFQQPVTRTADRTLIGPHETHVVSTHGQDINIHAPDAADFQSSLDAVLDSFAYHVRNIRQDHREPELDVVIIPGKRSGSAAEEIYLGDMSTHTGINLLGHEYTHIRDNYSGVDTFEMTWLSEGHAQYMQRLMSYRQGYLTWEGTGSFLSLLKTNRDLDSEVKLTDRFTWLDNEMNYYKGARVLAALDQRIRDHSGGAATYQDVALKLNRRYSLENDQKLGYDDFVSLVEEVAGTSLKKFIDETVDGTGTVPLPDDESLFPQGEIDFDVQLAATAEFPGTRPTDGGDSVFARVNVENVGTDPSVTPTAELDWPDGWTLANTQMSQYLAEGEPDTAVATPWRDVDQGRFTTQTFAPGDRTEIAMLLETDAAPTGDEAIGLSVTDTDGVTASDSTTLAEHFLFARLDIPEEVGVDADATLDASATVSPEGTEITGYTFSYDGRERTTAESTLTVSFSTTGTYDVAVTVETADGQTDTASATLTVVDTDSGEGCFITTATATEPATLDSLRRFRDDSMAATPLGRGLVGLYYQISPPLARTLTRHPDSRTTRVTRGLVRRCAALSDRQERTGSPIEHVALAVLLTVMYVIGVATAATGHAGIRAAEVIDR